MATHLGGVCPVSKFGHEPRVQLRQQQRHLPRQHPPCHLRRRLRRFSHRRRPHRRGVRFRRVPPGRPCGILTVPPAGIHAVLIFIAGRFGGEVRGGSGALGGVCCGLDVREQRLGEAESGVDDRRGYGGSGDAFEGAGEGGGGGEVQEGQRAPLLR